MKAFPRKERYLDGGAINQGLNAYTASKRLCKVWREQYEIHQGTDTGRAGCTAGAL